MNLSTEAIGLKRLTKDSENIMTNATNKTGPTRADRARTVMAAAYPDGKTTTLQDKQIITKLMAAALLTKRGATQYLQEWKDNAGIR